MEERILGEDTEGWAMIIKISIYHKKEITSNFLFYI